MPVHSCTELYGFNYKKTAAALSLQSFINLIIPSLQTTVLLGTQLDHWISAMRSFDDWNIAASTIGRQHTCLMLLVQESAQGWTSRLVVQRWLHSVVNIRFQDRLRQRRWRQPAVLEGLPESRRSSRFGCAGDASCECGPDSRGQFSAAHHTFQPDPQALRAAGGPAGLVRSEAGQIRQRRGQHTSPCVAVVASPAAASAVGAAERGGEG